MSKERQSSKDYIDSIFVVNGEMIPENGEDSYSFSVKDNNGYLSVFDGCGGIGSRKYEVHGGKTGAYIASHVCADVLFEWFDQHPVDEIKLTQKTVTSMCDELKEAFSAGLAEYEDNTQKSLIKGSLSKSFPTTLSGILFKYDHKKYTSSFIWAGDSRGFILTPRGLTQITRDDVSGEEDALSNLSNDGVLTNHIYAKGDYTLNQKIISHDKYSILITATDGCFGYFSSPMEFEYMLLDTLLHSSCINEWKALLNDYIQQYTGDDYTIGIALFGFGSFKKLKYMFRRRHRLLLKKYILNLEEATQTELADMWRDYKKIYYRKYTEK